MKAGGSRDFAPGDAEALQRRVAHLRPAHMAAMTTPVNSWLDQYALPIVTDKESAHAYKQPTEMMPNFKVRSEFSVTRSAPYAQRAPAAHSTHASAPQTLCHTLRPSHPCTLHLLSRCAASTM